MKTTIVWIIGIASALFLSYSANASTIRVDAEVLQVETEDVEIIAEAVKEDEIVAEAVEEYVERAVENADVENYTLADVVTEVQYENFLENPIETFVDLDFEGITLDNIGDDMTSDQREKAQEVVVPVILTRIASMAAFVFRRSLWLTNYGTGLSKQ